MNFSTPGLPVHHLLPESTQTHLHWVGDAIQPSYPLSSFSSCPSLSSIRVFSNESALCIRWPKYWSFSFSISPSNEHPGLIFRMDWLDLLAVQGTLKSLLQHHSSTASILRCSAFFMVQLSHPYVTTGKTIALTRRTFVDKVMSLLFNISLDSIKVLWREQIGHGFFFQIVLIFFNKILLLIKTYGPFTFNINCLHFLMASFDLWPVKSQFLHGCSVYVIVFFFHVT